MTFPTVPGTARGWWQRRQRDDGRDQRAGIHSEARAHATESNNRRSSETSPCDGDLGAGRALVGVGLVMMGTTLKIVLLVSVPELEVTVTWLVVPSARTTAVR